MFVGIIPVKPPQNLTCPLGMPRGLKSLLHILNASVSPTTEDTSFMLSFYLSFYFAKGLARYKFVGV
jgi:hypothetical protein